MICGEANSVRHEATVSLEETALAHQVNVRLYGEARRRQQQAGGHHGFTVKAEAVGELEPALNTARPILVAVVVLQSFAPFTPERVILAAANQRGVLQRDHRLVVITIECPRLDLRLAACAAVQHAMERMQVVVPLCQQLAQAAFQALRSQRVVQSCTSIPS